MRANVYKAAVLILLATLIGVVIVFGWPQYQRHAVNASLDAFVRHSHEITSVEVLRLTGTGESGPAGAYRVRYDGSQRGIAVYQTLAGPPAAELLRVWGNVRLVAGYMAGCHEPEYVLRFLSGRRCRFEVIICFHCENISWQPTPFFTALRQMAPTALYPKSGLDELQRVLALIQ